MCCKKTSICSIKEVPSTFVEVLDTFQQREKATIKDKKCDLICSKLMLDTPLLCRCYSLHGWALICLEWNYSNDLYLVLELHVLNMFNVGMSGPDVCTTLSSWLSCNCEHFDV